MVAVYSFFVDSINMLGVLLSSFYIFMKSLKIPTKPSRKLLSVLWCVFIAFLYAVSPAWFPSILVRPLHCVLSILFIFALTKQKRETIISAFLLSYGVSYFLNYISAFLIALAFSPLVQSENLIENTFKLDSPIYILIFILISGVQILLSFLLFRIRRFKNGFPFLQHRQTVIFALIVAGTVLILTTWANAFYRADNTYAITLFFIGVLIVGVGAIIGIRRGIKASYLRWVQKNNDELHKKEIAEKDREIQRLTELSEAQRVINHNINHRLAASERILFLLAEKTHGMDLEISDEIALARDDLKRLSKEYQSGINRSSEELSLPSTKVPMLDALFKHFAEKYADAAIDFRLKVNGSILYMIEHIITQSKLETLVGNHLQDALTAINAGENSFRSVLAEIGVIGDYYEFKVYDGGIPFGADTLLRLGTERVTTHAAEGGSGIGFMTTFETIRECGASLIIRENAPDNISFSKSVTIRFDGMNQYILETYRPEVFSGANSRGMIIRVH